MGSIPIAFAKKEFIKMKYICNHAEGCSKSNKCQHGKPHEWITYESEATKSCENIECEEVIFDVECIEIMEKLKC
jgi:hypothetical protein